MFYGSHKVNKKQAMDKTYKFPWGQGGLILLTCILLGSCATPQIGQSSRQPPEQSTGQSSRQSSSIPAVANSNTANTANTTVSGVDSAKKSSGTSAGQSAGQSTPIVQKTQARLEAQKLPFTAKITIGDQVIDLEVAKTPQEQEIGLMFRTDLPPNQGMLFPFQPARPVAFWMRNTLIPLDMIFLKDGVIRAIVTQVPPCTANPCPTYGPAFNVDIDQVIELRNGRAGELGLQVDDRLTVEFLP